MAKTREQQIDLAITERRAAVVADPRMTLFLQTLRERFKAKRDELYAEAR